MTELNYKSITMIINLIDKRVEVLEKGISGDIGGDKYKIRESMLSLSGDKSDEEREKDDLVKLRLSLLEEINKANFIFGLQVGNKSITTLGNTNA